MGRLAAVRTAEMAKLAFCGVTLLITLVSAASTALKLIPLNPSRTEDIIQANVIDKSLWLLSNSILLV
jgi:hypothetical protein